MLFVTWQREAGTGIFIIPTFDTCANSILTICLGVQHTGKFGSFPAIWCSQSKSHAPRSVQYSSTGTAQFVPKGYCQKLHNGVECVGCSSKHQCHKCDITHPASKCNFQPQRQRNSNQPRGARSRSANTNKNQ